MEADDDLPKLDSIYSNGKYFEGDLAISRELIEAYYEEPLNAEVSSLHIYDCTCDYSYHVHSLISRLSVKNFRFTESLGMRLIMYTCLPSKLTAPLSTHTYHSKTRKVF